MRKVGQALCLILFLLGGCRASSAGDPEVEAILADLEDAYPLAGRGDPLVRGSLGGINVWAYCLSVGYPAVGYRRGYFAGPGAARDNWVCQRGSEQLAPEDYRLIDMDAACNWQFGRSDLVARPQDEDHAWSWNCHAS